MLQIINFLFWGIIACTFCLATAEETRKGHSVFVSDQGRNNVTFAINLPGSPSDDNQEIFYHLTGPIDNSWIAVGFGAEMKGSLMFVIYTKNGGKGMAAIPDRETRVWLTILAKEITVSPRTANGNSEPSFDPNISITMLPNSDPKYNGRYVANWKCTDCRQWRGGAININETAQKMIYAVGPSRSQLDSSRGDAALRRHDWYGKFTINLQQAQGDHDNFVNLKPTQTDGALKLGSQTGDRDFASPAHAVFMTGTFVIIFPLGAVWVRIFESVRLHWMTQVLGVLAIFIGAAIGINLSRQYNRSKDYSAPHQIIGFTILFLLVLQLCLGALHHRAYKKTAKPTIMSRIHRVLGPLIIGLGLVNGALGFKFATTPRHIIGYAIIIIIVSGIVIVAIMVHDRRRRRKAVFDTPAARNFQNAYVAPEHQNAIPLAHTSDPPPPYPGR